MLWAELKYFLLLLVTANSWCSIFCTSAANKNDLQSVQKTEHSGQQVVNDRVVGVSQSGRHYNVMLTIEPNKSVDFPGFPYIHAIVNYWLSEVPTVNLDAIEKSRKQNYEKVYWEVVEIKNYIPNAANQIPLHECQNATRFAGDRNPKMFLIFNELKLMAYKSYVTAQVFLPTQNTSLEENSSNGHKNISNRHNLGAIRFLQPTVPKPTVSECFLYEEWIKKKFYYWICTPITKNVDLRAQIALFIGEIHPLQIELEEITLQKISGQYKARRYGATLKGHMKTLESIGGLIQPQEGDKFTIVRHTDKYVD